VTPHEWLRCARDTDWILRGSLLLNALIPEARPPVDVDYLVPGPFDPDATLARAQSIAPITRSLVLYGETKFPGLRLFAGALQVDFGFGDPLPAQPRPIAIDGVGPVLACTPETLFGWKVHGLVEHGRGRWRAKDLFDLHLMWTRLRLDRAELRAAIELAFTSRETPISALDDFRTRLDWGESRGGRRKWRTLVAAKPPFGEVREIVRRSVAEIIG
jgi:hypothetical protein